MEEAKGSIPFSSTPPGVQQAPGLHFLAGFVAGEGHFGIVQRPERAKSGAVRERFVFQVETAARDRPLLERLRAHLGCGAIYDQPPARAHWQPTSSYVVKKSADLERSVVPFAELLPLPSAKRRQFETWRDRLLAYRAAPHRSVGRCAAEGCDSPVRGRGLCRRHYYRATGH